MPARDLSEAIQKASDLLHKARLAIALTGAGSSTPSGIPDFRTDKSGLWNRDDPMTVASLTGFRRHPEKFYGWLKPLAQSIFAAQPNPAHVALARLEEAGILKAIITQNIDGLHQKAGSQNVLEIHGSLRHFSCPRCYTQFPAEGYITPYLSNGSLPLCPVCKSVLKPDIVLFEEMLPVDLWEKAEGLARSCDVMVVSGSSLVVMPVAELPYLALQNGAQLIINNLTPTYLDAYAAVLLPADLASVMPQLADTTI